MVITIALSFTGRCLIIYFFTLDLTCYYYFFFVNLLVSFIRPLITDLVDIYLENKITLNISVYSRNSREHKQESKYKQPGEHTNRVYTKPHNIEDDLDYKYKIKRRFFLIFVKTTHR